MSYILDALRKSDQQRQRGVPPALLAPQAAEVVPRRRMSTSHVLLTAVVLVGAGIVIGSLRPWQTEQPAPATQAAAMDPLASSPRPSPVPVQPQMAQKSEPDLPARNTAPAARSAPALAAGAMQPQLPAGAKPQTRGKPVNRKVLTIAELPVSIRRQIPTVSISVHAYARAPKDRLVSVNDRVLREGDYLAPGLRLEQITRNGVILRYKGYRFRRGVR